MKLNPKQRAAIAVLLFEADLSLSQRTALAHAFAELLKGSPRFNPEAFVDRCEFGGPDAKAVGK